VVSAAGFASRWYSGSCRSNVLMLFSGWGGHLAVAELLSAAADRGGM